MFPKKEIEETVSSCTLAHLREKKREREGKKGDLGNVIESGVFDSGPPSPASLFLSFLFLLCLGFLVLDCFPFSSELSF